MFLIEKFNDSLREKNLQISSTDKCGTIKKNIGNKLEWIKEKYGQLT